MRGKVLFLRLIIGYFCIIIACLYIIHTKTVRADDITTADNGDGSLSSDSSNDLNPDGSEAYQGELHAFYPAYVSFSEQLQNYIDDVDSVSFAWARFETNNPGFLNTVRGQYGNLSFYYPKDYIQPVTYAKSQGKSIQLSIFMSGTGSVNSLPNEDTQAVMIQSIIDLLQKDISNGNGIYFDGVVIDFEGLRDTDNSKNPILYNGKPISTYYIEFLNSLKAELTPLGKKLYVAVNTRDYYDGFNYAEILKVADRVILMAHSYDPSSAYRISKNQALQYAGVNTTSVNSLAPIQKVTKALMDMQNAASDPSDLKKVWLQICFDSAQWKFDVDGPGGWDNLSGSALSRSGKPSPSYKLIKDMIDNTQGYGQNITYGYNDILQSPIIQYYNTQDKSWNVILYEDSNSIGAKIDLVKSLGMGGISVWSISNVPDYNDSKGMEFHLDGWSTIVSKMNNTALPDDSIQYVTFTDPGVEKAIRKNLDKMTEGITQEDLNGIIGLTLSGSIKSLDDLKMLVNLEHLDARNLNIKDISALSNLTNLKWINLNYNQISDISSLNNLKNLECLYLNNNNIVSIKPLSELTKLQILGLRSNKITDITALSKLIGINELNLANNSVSSIKSLSGLKKLNVLYLNNNHITTVDALAKLTSLNTLNLMANKITKIAPLKGLINLKSLYLKGNQVKDYRSIKGIYLKRGFTCDFKKLK